MAARDMKMIDYKIPVKCSQCDQNFARVTVFEKASYRRRRYWCDGCDLFVTTVELSIQAYDNLVRDAEALRRLETLLTEMENKCQQPN